MQQSRFVFLSVPVAGDPGGQPGEDSGGQPGGDLVSWMLVSPNNRALGRGGRQFSTYSACRDAVLSLREGHDRMTPTASAVEASGQWSWRVDLDGATVAVASRSYLRARECQYNLQRFLEAVPAASVVPGTRSVRGVRLRPAFGSVS